MSEFPQSALAFLRRFDEDTPMTTTTTTTTGDTAMTTPTYKVRGINDDETSCCCCGRTGLKRVVWLEVCDAEGNGTGDVKHYGTHCAGSLVLGRKTRKNGELIAKEAAAHDYAAKWIGVYGTDAKILQKIASAIRCSYCPAAVVGDRILIGTELHGV